MFKKIIVCASCIIMLVVLNISAFAAYGAYDEDASTFDNAWYFPEIEFTYVNYENQGADYFFGETLFPLKVADTVSNYDGMLYSYNEFFNAQDGSLLDIYRGVFSTRVGDDRALSYVFDSWGETCDYLDITIKYENIVCSENFDDVTYTIPSFAGGGNVNGWVYVYYETENGLSSDVIPITYTPTFTEVNDITMISTFTNGDLFDIDYADYEFIELELHYISNWSQYYISEPFSIAIPDNGTSYDGCFRPINQNDVVVHVTSFEEFNFLRWVTNAVSGFLDTKIFTIGSVDVTLGVCFLLPLSLGILIAFLKKFSGG